MSAGSWFAVSTIAAALPAAMAAGAVLVRRGLCRAELARKLIHLALGVVALSLPWTVGTREGVIIIALLAGVWFAALRLSGPLQSHFGLALRAVGRSSAGEFYFTAGSCLTYLAARGAPLHYCVPMAVLVFADSAAALVGTAPRVPHHPLGAAGKTWEGSLAFFATAFMVTCVALTAIPARLPLPGVVLASLIAFDATLIELWGLRGSDNLLVPLGVCALLLALEGAPEATVLLHLVVACAAVPRLLCQRVTAQQS